MEVLTVALFQTLQVEAVTADYWQKMLLEVLVAEAVGRGHGWAGNCQVVRLYDHQRAAHSASEGWRQARIVCVCVRLLCAVGCVYIVLLLDPS